MILDRLEQADLYNRINPRFKKAFAFLRSGGLGDIPDGRHEIDGDDIYAVIVHGTCRPADQAELEIHRKYIDVHYIISGQDQIGWKNLKLCKNSTAPYDAESDGELFHDTASVWLAVNLGEFAVFFPEDAHAPGTGKGTYHKVVVKVAVK